jgi:hypothetical protein
MSALVTLTVVGVAAAWAGTAAVKKPEASNAPAVTPTPTRRIRVACFMIIWTPACIRRPGLSRAQPFWRLFTSYHQERCY